MKRLLIVILSVLLLPAGIGAQSNKIIYQKGWIDFNKNDKKDIYEDPSQPIEKRVKDLLSQMTVAEKTCQMATLYGSGRVLRDPLPTTAWKDSLWKDGIGNIDEQHNGLGTFKSEYSFPYGKSVDTRQKVQRWFVEQTRLGIPVDYTNEGIRGLCHDRATMFPAQCGQGATWNKNLIAKIAEVEAKEAVALGYTNIYSPILDIAQDPRWGRVVECYGEDPYLVGSLGKEMIKGLQAQGLVATPKHFAVYSAPVGGRDGGTRTDPHVAYREMRTLYLEPFRMAFQEAGALGVMSSYNDYDGVPVSASNYFLTQILRQEWGFKGYVVSDSEAVEFVHTKHKVAETMEDAVAMVAKAGLNIRTQFTSPADFVLPLRRAIEQGKVSMETINQRVAEILTVKFQMGLFDNPYKGDVKQVEKIVHSKEHQEVSLEAARQSIVLLKNQGNLLPLSKEIKSIALIGPNADEKKELICRYGPANAPITTVYEAFKSYLPNTAVHYSKGCEIVDKRYPLSEILPESLDKEEQQMIDDAVKAAQQSEVVVLVLGGSEVTVREEKSRTDLNLPGRQLDLMKAVQATGKPVVLVLLDGRASTINYAEAYIPAIVHAWFPGEFTGQAITDVLFGDYNPGGKLAVTFPKSVGQIPFAFPFKPGSDVPATSSVSGALYPFGYGLSYTTFAYDKLKITPEKQNASGEINVSFSVKNTGNRKGDEIVQLYIHDEYSSVTTYTKVLRGFDRITLEPGETKQVSFTLTKQDLGLWNINNEFVVEPGTFEVLVGASSQDIRLKGKFEIMPQDTSRAFLLTGASFAVKENSWFEIGCKTLNVKPINRAVSAQAIMHTAMKMFKDSLYTTSELDNIDLFVIMHVHNRDVADTTQLKENYKDYTYEEISNSYSRGYDYVIKRYKADCLALKDNPASKYYGTKEGKSAHIMLCTHWHDARTIYNTAIRKLAARWNLPVVEFDKNIGFTKDVLIDGKQPSIAVASETEKIDGVAYGWHPKRGDHQPIQQKMAQIFVEEVKKVDHE